MSVHQIRASLAVGVSTLCDITRVCALNDALATTANTVCMPDIASHNNFIIVIVAVKFLVVCNGCSIRNFDFSATMVSFNFHFQIWFCLGLHKRVASMAWWHSGTVSHKNKTPNYGVRIFAKY